MEIEEIQRRFRWPAFILGILFVILGIWGLFQPQKAISGIVWLIGFSLLLSGVLDIALFFGFRGGIHGGITLASGILNVIVAILIFSNTSSGVLFLGYLFAFGFIFDSINAIQLSTLSFHPGFNTVIGVLGLVAGILLLFNPLFSSVFAVYIILFYLILFGALLIARAF